MIKIEYPDRIRVDAARPKQIGGVGFGASWLTMAFVFVK